jgi:TPR repeat protein
MVAAELAKLIKRDAEFTAHLLRGRPTKLKSGVDAATGARYLEALERLGVVVRLEPETLEVDADLSAPTLPSSEDQAVAKTPESESTRVGDKIDFGTDHSNGPSGEREAVKKALALTSAETDTPTTEILSKEALYKAAIGPKNQSFYLNYFAKAERKEVFLLSWHWPACFATLGWLFYRKLYVVAICYLVITFGSGFLAGYKHGFYSASGDLPATRAWLLALVLLWILEFVLPALLANGIYYRHVAAKIEAARNAHGDPSHQLREITLVGGTSWLAAVIGLLLYVAGVAWFRVIVDDYVSKLNAANQQMAPTSGAKRFIPDLPPQAVGPGVSAEVIMRERESAERGRLDSQYNVGLAYFRGDGVTQDYGEAMKWMRRAADQGDAEAQYMVGVMYYHGRGVQADSAEAYKWTSLAVSRSSTTKNVEWLEDARRKRNLLASRITPEQLADAQKFVQQWTAMTQPSITSAHAQSTQPQVDPSLYKIEAEMNQAQQSGNAGRAAELAQLLTQEAPSWGSGWNMLGYLANERGQVDRAEAAYRRGLTVDPRNALLLANLGTLLAKRGDHAEGLRLLNQAGKLAPSDERIRANIATVQAQAAEDEKLERQRKAFLSTVPSFGNGGR